MKHFYRDLTLAVLMVVGALLFYACSGDTFLSEKLTAEPIKTNNSIGAVSNIIVRTGYTDSVSIKKSADFINLELDSILPDKENYLAKTMKYLNRLPLEWEEASEASEYELRVYQQPVTADNWEQAQQIPLEDIRKSEGKVSVLALLYAIPQVFSSKCVNCGDCIKSCKYDAIISQGGKSYIDPAKCVNCGECYKACTYSAIRDGVVGKPYFVGIRGKNGDGEYSEQVTSTKDAYMVQYSTIASIPDTVMLRAQKNGKFKDVSKKQIGSAGCQGNCGFKGDCDPLEKDDLRAGAELGAGGCYIVNPIDNLFGKNGETVCPVDAIYSVEDGDSTTKKFDTTAAITEFGNTEMIPTVESAIFIDKDKCINCGRCVQQCYHDNGFGAVTSQIVKVVGNVFN